MLSLEKEWKMLELKKIVKLVSRESERIRLVSELSYYSIKWFSENLLATEMKEINLKMNKLIYLGMTILDVSKILMHEFWYGYLKPKYKENLNLCYVDTDSFIFSIKIRDWYKTISDGIEQRFDTSNIQAKVPIKKGVNKKIFGMMKDKPNGEIMKECIGLRPKCYAYLRDNGKIGKRDKCVKNVLQRNILNLVIINTV